MCSNCSNCSNGNNWNSGNNAENVSNSSGSNNNTCRIAVTVEDNFAPCTFPEKYFDVLIRSRDGSTTLSGRVAGGGSAIFNAPCCGEYSVTVTGNEYSSPRSQTRRINCICGQTAGVTFIFMTFEPDCPPKFCPPCPPPCPPGPPCCAPTPPCPCPPHPPRPPKPVQPRASLLGDIISEIISEE
ncbi:MAG: hypothetical protein K2J73_00160 [Oscillospiraceae bacterium]|nr:hypothetical protein [Oscillospiraceae bacterium]